MNDKINIRIRIADQAPIQLYIPHQEEEQVRKAERAANSLWKVWRSEFSDKSSAELLAMMTFRFAQLYIKADEENSSVSDTLASFESVLDKSLS